MPPIEVANDNAVALADNEVGRALAEVTVTNTKVTALVARARELAATFKDVAFDVTTTKGLEEARKAREALREEARYPIQKLQKAGSKMLGTMQRQFNAQCDAFVAEVEGYERPIDDQIKAEEGRKEREREEREAKEAARKQQYMDAIAGITTMATVGSSMDSAGLRKLIVAAESVDLSIFAEYTGMATQAKAEALRQLNGMLVAAMADEQERAELEVERARQAAWKADMEARERALAERERAMREQEETAARQREEQERAARERATAIERRLAGIEDLLAAALNCEHSKDARAYIDRLPPQDEMTADLYGEQVGAAIAMRNSAFSRMAQRYEELRGHEFTRNVADAINTFGLMASDAADALEDGSADLTGLRDGLEKIRAFPLDWLANAPEYGVVTAARDNAGRNIEAIIVKVEARDKERAEQQERERRQSIADHAMRQQHLRMQAKAAEMFALVKRFRQFAYDLPIEIENADYAAMDAIINFVEGVEQ